MYPMKRVHPTQVYQDCFIKQNYITLPEAIITYYSLLPV